MVWKQRDAHLRTGVSADPLRMESYIPAFFKTNAVFALDLGITIHPGAHLIIVPKGKFQKEGRRIRHDKYGVGSYVLTFRVEAAGAKDIEITEVDIDSFIKAKGAIFSAIRTMLVSLDFDTSMIDRVFVEGGIGSGINMKNAVRIGMFPDIPIEKYQYIGNSSLAGAYAILSSTPAEEKTYELSQNMTHLELSTVPTYMDEFIACCFLPHTDASLFSNL